MHPESLNCFPLLFLPSILYHLNMDINKVRELPQNCDLAKIHRLRLRQSFILHLNLGLLVYCRNRTSPKWNVNDQHAVVACELPTFCCGDVDAVRMASRENFQHFGTSANGVSKSAHCFKNNFFKNERVRCRRTATRAAGVVEHNHILKLVTDYKRFN